MISGPLLLVGCFTNDVPARSVGGSSFQDFDSIRLRSAFVAFGLARLSSALRLFEHAKNALMGRLGAEGSLVFLLLLGIFQGPLYMAFSASYL